MMSSNYRRQYPGLWDIFYEPKCGRRYSSQPFEIYADIWSNYPMAVVSGLGVL